MGALRGNPWSCVWFRHIQGFLSSYNDSKTIKKEDIKLEWNSGGGDGRQITVEGIGMDLLKHIICLYE